MAKTSNQTNGNENTGGAGFEGMATLPQGYNLDHGDYLGFNGVSAKAEVEAMKRRIEALQSGLKVLPYAQKIAELEAEFYKKLGEFRKAVIRREISKQKAEADLRVSLQALGVQMDKIMGTEAQRKTDLLTRANEWKAKAELKAANRSSSILPGTKFKQKA